MSVRDGRLAWFRRLLDLRTRGERVRFVLGHPILFSGADLLSTVQERLQAMPLPIDVEAWNEALAWLSGVRKAFIDSPLEYPIDAGLGPVERIAAEQEQGVINGAETLRRARSPEVAELISPVYAEALGQFALREAARPERREHAVLLQRIATAASEAMPEIPEKDTCRGVAGYYTIEVAKIALAQLPDGRVFGPALEAARWMIARAERAGKPEALSRARWSMGTLHLNPFSAAKNPHQYDTEIWQWRRRFVDEVGDAEAARVAREHPMPEPSEALETAVVALRLAAEGVEGRLRARAQKALVQALHVKAVGLKLPVDRDELAVAGREALTVLDPNEAAALEIVGIFHDLGLPLDGQVTPAGAAPQGHAPPSGGAEAAHQLLFEAMALQWTDPAAGFALLEGAQARFADLEPGLRQARWQAMLHLQGRAHPEVSTEGLVHGAARSLFESTIARAQAERWTRDKTAGALFRIASSTTAIDDDEEVGLEVISFIAQELPEFIELHGELVGVLHAGLWDNLGAERANQKQQLPSIEAYSNAVLRFLVLGQVDGALKSLEGITRVLVYGDEGLGQQAAPALAKLALAVERNAGPRATELLQRAYRAALATFGQSVNNESLAGLLSLAKGYAMATTLRLEHRYDPHADQVVGDGCARIAALEATLAPTDLRGAARAALTPLQEEVVLASYLGRDPPRPGASAIEAIDNLRFQVDRHIAARALAAVELAAQEIADDAGLRASLDDETVLLDLYSGAFALEPRRFTLARILTREATEVAVSSVGASEGESVGLTIASRELRAHPLAPAVAVMRDAIQRDPEDEEAGAADSPTERLVADLSSEILGPSTVRLLKQLRKAGKTHLCVCAHGPLHFAPAHILSASTWRLADDFTVTQLPNLGLLTRRARRQSAAPSDRRSGAAVFGLTFTSTNRFGLSPLMGAGSEASAVASALGVEAVPESAATRSALLGALRTRRFVHLATHGSQWVDAAAFHHLFLQPEADDDGRLFACELMGESLAGLEVLTLSACESGLGRFDEGDNLRGLAASLLEAGCQALVGTLWRVEDQAARHFFTTFYRALVGGNPVRAAFRSAQKALRAERPVLRDWAPFYLIEA